MGASERWVGVNNVAAHLGVARDSVYRWIDERGLPAHRVGRLFRFKLSEIDEWVCQNIDLPAPQASPVCVRRAGRRRGRAREGSKFHSKPTLLESPDESINTKDTFTEEGWQ